MGMEVDDPFVGFVDYAISVLSPPDEDEDEDANKPPWSWAWGRIIKTCRAYSSGVTPAILLSELSQAWAENQRGGGYYYSQKKKKTKRPDQLQKNRVKLPNTVTIDTIYDKNFLSFTTLLQVVILDVFLLPGTNFYMLTLGDFWSSNTIDLYLHRRFYDLADLKNGILKKGRELLLTGCYLRTTTRGSGRHLRLLPTEYLLIILDEDEDDDAMLLAAQFCSDSLASVSVDEGVSYSLYARWIESIGSLEIQGSLQKKQITLVDNDNFRIKFLLWGDQVVLANCFSVGSWLALDQPFVSSCMESEEICLEYGSVTQLYIVPFIRHEEQVSVASTQGSKKLTTAADSSQGPKVSQVTLPCDSRGAIDFSNYPFRLFVADLRDKMSNISIYGVVTDIKKPNIPESSSTRFSLRVEDPTGGIWANLHFVKSWSLGKISIGHTVYIAGLTCAAITKCQSIEVSWDEKDGGCLFVNLSCLPALLNSSCLHKASTLSDLSANTHVCRIWLDQIEHCDVSLRYFHTSCGHIATQNSGFECNFCGCDCNDDIVPGFHLKVTIADDTGKVLAWCTGHTAAELLQISPDEFFNLPEEEQMMYPSSLEHERFIVALVNSKQGTVVEEDDVSIWEITQALKSD
ncbi:putative Cell division control protein 24, OB domain 2 [Helianthus annuus]|uniref:Cell division control protein 24, OB domain 2 n=1 Tax=Helianthus annuus TaxID=4232 RepID=A0A9K3II72_HELAN|nr:putative Cell division control protein 24, OB domain 2 [Helianthus annuus]KAJ0540245.1 putative Cell division control protein 24, OB domain 2 [Helianthus annuus]KAJ0554990.1 putative Cell division control protein 24, OB domain 2 [Helianthus annuus]KAJ0720558.1 putative Cell division control protein 24, OB domain 2 [Helianthus annuus]KAJ0723755.1 putative Cell division control protein 24, OB domain 2 [Helianthus annuus]